ncbi:MAG TPA: nucleotidyltransferase domain-containing protein [Candidatus Micrarchaeaceae archaeon]|nr:nucleotidyltransferase domain-containing protein [Candidatus Micrarchaeaceae archaeon]
MTLDQVRARREAIRRTLESAGGVNPRLFGSLVRGVADEKSDVDILIDLREPEPQGFAFFGALDRMERELGQLLGASVHVSVVDPLSAAGKRILAEAVPL